MKMKRYIANGTQQAFQMVKDELGPDALILSNRTVAEGVEIIAAIDYEDELRVADVERNKIPVVRCADMPATESQHCEARHAEEASPEHIREVSSDVTLRGVSQEIRSLRSMLEVPLSKLVWAESGRHSPFRSSLITRLRELGLHSMLANVVADQCVDCGDHEEGWQQALVQLENLLPAAEDNLLNNGGIAALVGPTGVGKTTSVAKLAARFALQHGRRKVALVTMDHYRIGAHDQLRTYGKLLGVPVYMAGDQEELRVILNQMSDRKLILIDTAGTSQRDPHLSEQFAMLDVEGIPIQRYLVMSATGQTNLNDQVVSEFSSIKPDRCIITKVDEATSLGGALSVLIKHGLAAVYMGNGQRVPDDFHPLTAKSMITEALKLVEGIRPAQSDEVWMQALGVMEAAAHAHAHA